ncbi:MAG: hypothetical protein N5P05_001940 [Chroococcopsis gigantea SAG 12.99]|jgi:DNA repair photolyase|nr:radical SAM protein [Chlorogloea purpurea SAG 13.99]MDV3000334.1 hypothetical protein [Chroococcopsis gigantea SAG 12.99]
MQNREQLSLFSVGRYSGLDNYVQENKPDKLGNTLISYRDSSSILTPAKGFMGRYKFTLNPYSGCSFGCDYCYARFFSTNKEDLETWGQWVRVKENAVQLIRKARTTKNLDKRLAPDDTIYLSSVTDPYQAIEKYVGLTRKILEELVDVQPRLTIQTRSPLVVRDIDILQKFQHRRVNITISTDSDEVRAKYEPHCPSIKSRLVAAQKLVEANIPIGISISPMLPILNAHEFGRILANLDAAEYVTQFCKPSRARFTSGTSTEFLMKLKEDDWNEEKYRLAKTIIAQALGTGGVLLEGDEGYAPT